MLLRVGTENKESIWKMAFKVHSIWYDCNEWGGMWCRILFVLQFVKFVAVNLVIVRIFYVQ